MFFEVVGFYLVYFLVAFAAVIAIYFLETVSFSLE